MVVFLLLVVGISVLRKVKLAFWCFSSFPNKQRSFPLRGWYGCDPWRGRRKVKMKLLSCVRLLATPWTAAHQAPPFMGFSRQEYWSAVTLLYPLFMLLCPKSTVIFQCKTFSTRPPNLVIPWCVFTAILLLSCSLFFSGPHTFPLSCSASFRPRLNLVCYRLSFLGGRLWDGVHVQEDF